MTLRPKHQQVRQENEFVVKTLIVFETRVNQRKRIAAILTPKQCSVLEVRMGVAGYS